MPKLRRKRVKARSQAPKAPPKVARYSPCPMSGKRHDMPVACLIRRGAKSYFFDCRLCGARVFPGQIDPERHCYTADEFAQAFPGAFIPEF